MKTLMFASFCLIFFSICSGACKKNDNKINNSDTSGLVLLRDKSLNEIKSILLGNWTVHYSSGGITGTTKTPYQNSYFRFLSNDSVYIVFSNLPNTADRATFVKRKTAFGYDAWCLDFTLLNGVKNQLIVDFKYYDTLMLTQNAIDGVVFAMTK